MNDEWVTTKTITIKKRECYEEDKLKIAYHTEIPEFTLKELSTAAAVMLKNHIDEFVTEFDANPWELSLYCLAEVGCSLDRQILAAYGTSLKEPKV